MTIISTEDQETIRKLFAERLPDDVRITNFTQRQSLLIVPGHECQYCQQTRELLEEVTSLSDRLTLETKDFLGDGALAAAYGVERIPAFILEGKAKGRVRQFGIPAGYEFSALIEDLLDVSTGESGLSAATKAAIAKVDRPIHLQVFVTPT